MRERKLIKQNNFSRTNLNSLNAIHFSFMSLWRECRSVDDHRWFGLAEQTRRLLESCTHTSCTIIVLVHNEQTDQNVYTHSRLDPFSTTDQVLPLCLPFHLVNPLSAVIVLAICCRCWSSPPTQKKRSTGSPKLELFAWLPQFAWLTKEWNWINLISNAIPIVWFDNKVG